MSLRADFEVNYITLITNCVIRPFISFLKKQIKFMGKLKTVPNLKFYVDTVSTSNFSMYTINIVAIVSP